MSCIFLRRIKLIAFLRAMLPFDLFVRHSVSYSLYHSLNVCNIFFSLISQVLGFLGNGIFSRQKIVICLFVFFLFPYLSIASILYTVLVSSLKKEILYIRKSFYLWWHHHNFEKLIWCSPDLHSTSYALILHFFFYIFSPTSG